jgi:beta-phosphoglucomutase
MIEAVIFDFDGVIVDSEPLHHQAFCLVAGEEGVECDWETYCRDYIGFDDRDLFRTAFADREKSVTEAHVQQLVEAKAQAFIDLTRAGVDTYDGIPDIVRTLHGRWPVAICSGALRSDIEPILAQLQLGDLLSVRVTAEDVSASKPDPACYLLAVERLSAHVGRALVAARCVAIEDTPTGVLAAKRAGLQAWAVTHTHADHQLREADRIFPSLPALAAALADGI